MATPALNVCRQALRRSHRTQWLSYRQRQSCSPTYSRTFCSTSTLREEKGNDTKGGSAAAQVEETKQDNSPYFNDDFYKSLYSGAKDSYLKSEPSERRKLEELYESMQEELGPSSTAGRDMDALVEREVYAARDEVSKDVLEKPDRTRKPSYDFSGMNDPDRDIAPDEVFRDDDITSLAHAQLDVHREMREYSRLAAWEMPLLSTLAVPFSKPSPATTPLRWRYTTYLGTPHPAANKVVLSFRPSDLPLSAQQQAKLIKLAGPRYDPHKRTVKMSAESFPSQAQNKWLLGTQFAALMKEAKDSADTMEDIPFDFRHAKREAKQRFPREWALTEERRAYLQNAWAKNEGRAIEGAKMIDEARMQELVTPVPVAAPTTKAKGAAR